MCVVKYSVLNNGIEAENGEFELEIEPTRTVAKEIEYSVQAHTVIVFNYFDGEKHIAREQIVLSDAYKAEPISEKRCTEGFNSERKLLSAQISLKLFIIRQIVYWKAIFIMVNSFSIKILSAPKRALILSFTERLWIMICICAEIGIKKALISLPLKVKAEGILSYRR